MKIDNVLMPEEKKIKYEKFEESLKDYKKNDKNDEEMTKNKYGLSNKFLLLVIHFLLFQIREKQKLFEEYKNKNPNYQIEDPENLRRISESIKVYYSIRNVSSMFMANVVEYLLSDSKNNQFSKGKI